MLVSMVQSHLRPPPWPGGEAVNSYPFQGYIHGFKSRPGHQLVDKQIIIHEIVKKLLTKLRLSNIIII